MNYEFQILLNVARGWKESKGEIDPRVFTNADIDWDYLRRLAERHGMLPLLYLCLKDLESGAIATAFMDQLSKYFFENTHRNIYLLGELLKVIQIFKDHKIEAMPFKGPVLSKNIYDSYSIRQSGDLDILVKPEKVLGAITLLKGLGFRPHYPMTPNQIKAYVNISRENRMNLVHPENNLTIELHWRFYMSDIISKKVDAVVWSQLEYVDVNGIEIPVLKKEILFLFLCFHAFKHNWSRLFWLWEISTMAKMNPGLDWDWMIRNAKHFGGQKLFFLSLLIIDQAIGISIPGAIRSLASKDQISSEMINQATVPPKKPDLALNTEFNALSLDNRFNMSTNWWHRLKHRLYFIFTPNHYDIIAVNLPAKLGFIYYFLRPLRVLSKFFRSVFVRQD